MYQDVATKPELVKGVNVLTFLVSCWQWNNITQNQHAFLFWWFKRYDLNKTKKGLKASA